ncbi:MAG: formate dehydrogenase subunit gamma, partial [Gammaproteobacteria bacterium]
MKNLSRTKMYKITLSGILLVLFTFSLLSVAYVLFTTSETNAINKSNLDKMNRFNLWRSVRNAETGHSTISGIDTNVLINSKGITWRQIRNSVIASYGGYLMTAVLFLIFAFYAFRGPVQLNHGVSGVLVTRFTPYQRIVHWFVVILFMLLGATGLILLYGRSALIPMFGPTQFATLASASKEAHNLFGPIFLVALIMLFVEYVIPNFFKRSDLKWLANGGGMFNRHASAGRFNLGEKIWFWVVCCLGLMLSVTGLILVLWSMGWTRPELELAHLTHATVGVVFIAVSFGHIYLATAGTEGTLRGMTTGQVDRNWASYHHDQWSAEPDSSEAFDIETGRV